MLSPAQEAGSVTSHTGLVEAVNEPAGRWALPRLGEVWENRELVYFLGRRDIAVRYKQAALGAAWVILQPVLLALIFTVFLSLLGSRIPSNGAPPAVSAFTGVTMWLFFASAMSRCTESTVSNVELISKVYFPRLVIPIAGLAQPAFDFLVSFAVLLVVLVCFGVIPGLPALALPLILVIALGLALGVGLWLSALVVLYRDVKLLIPFLIQTLVFITPVLYPLDVVPDRFQALYALNPLVGVMEGFRWCLLPEAPAPGLLLLVPGATGVLLVIGGLLYFKHAESSFADVI